MAASGRPARYEVIWARPERAGRGPRPAHSRAEIAEAAVRLADAEGLDGVSMRKVAAEIGCGTMSLYNYVPAKEDLYELMIDAVGGEYAYPDRPSGDWRSELTALARQTRAIMHRHPWVPRLMSPVYMLGPNTLRYLEFGLWCLEGLELTGPEKFELIAMVNGVVTAYVRTELDLAEAARTSPYPPEQVQAARAGYLARTLAAGGHPRVAEAFTTGPVLADFEAAFDRALNRVLDAFELEARRQAPGDPGR